MPSEYSGYFKRRAPSETAYCGFYMQAEAQPERSLETESEQIMSLGEGRLWQVIIKLLQVFHTLHSLPFRYVSYRTTPETPN